MSLILNLTHFSNVESSIYSHCSTVTLHAKQEVEVKGFKKAFFWSLETPPIDDTHGVIP